MFAFVAFNFASYFLQLALLISHMQDSPSQFIFDSCFWIILDSILDQDLRPLYIWQKPHSW